VLPANLGGHIPKENKQARSAYQFALSMVAYETAYFFVVRGIYAARLGSVGAGLNFFI